MSGEQHGFILASVLFAIGAVAIVLYHHTTSTDRVINALGGGAPPPTIPADDASGLRPLSLAGMPMIGQVGLSQPPLSVESLNVGPNYTVN